MVRVGIDEAFNELKFHRFEAQITLNNIASR